VLLPVLEAKCTMADMATVDAVRAAKNQYKKAAFVCYINSSATVKAECDICCTSANAVKVVNSLLQDEIVFLPDMNLGNYVALNSDKKIILWHGYCPVHQYLTRRDVLKCKTKHPRAKFIAHPECRPEVLELADLITSTSGIKKYVAESPIGEEIIIGTEKSITLYLQKKYLNVKLYIPSEVLFCPGMALVGPEDILRSLEEGTFEISVKKDIADKARLTLERMLAIS